MKGGAGERDIRSEGSCAADLQEGYGDARACACVYE